MCMTAASSCCHTVRECQGPRASPEQSSQPAADEALALAMLASVVGSRMLALCLGFARGPVARFEGVLVRCYKLLYIQFCNRCTNHWFGFQVQVEMYPHNIAKCYVRMSRDRSDLPCSMYFERNTASRQDSANMQGKLCMFHVGASRN
jgi:hypothetical protein